MGYLVTGGGVESSSPLYRRNVEMRWAYFTQLRQGVPWLRARHGVTDKKTSLEELSFKSGQISSKALTKAELLAMS